MLLLRFLVLTLIAGGLAWGVMSLPASEASESLHDVETYLLRGEDFSPNFLNRQLRSTDAAAINDCDAHALNALSIMDMRLAERALRAGEANEFSRHTQSAGDRIRRLLSCVPHHSFSWLMAFNLDVLHGRLDDRSYRLLAMSYATSANEAWISIRRNSAVMPFLEIAPEAIRQTMLKEFRSLVGNGFVKEAAKVYLQSRASTQHLLNQEIEKLSSANQRSFWDSLDSIQS